MVACVYVCVCRAHPASEIANSRGSEAIRQQLAALEGAGIAAAGILASVPSCPLGVPLSLRKFAYKTARALVSAPQTSGAMGEEVAMVRRRNGDCDGRVCVAVGFVLHAVCASMWRVA